MTKTIELISALEVSYDQYNYWTVEVIYYNTLVVINLSDTLANKGPK